MKLGARDLRIKAARVLEEVRQGRPVTITYRNQAVAMINPLRSGKRSRAFEPIGFGIWTGRKERPPATNAQEGVRLSLE